MGTSRTITIDRATRAVLYRELEYELSGAGDCLRTRSRSRARRPRRRSTGRGGRSRRSMCSDGTSATGAGATSSGRTQDSRRGFAAYTTRWLLN